MLITNPSVPLFPALPIQQMRYIRLSAHLQPLGHPRQTHRRLPPQPLRPGRCVRYYCVDDPGSSHGRWRQGTPVSVSSPCHQSTPTSTFVNTRNPFPMLSTIRKYDKRRSNILRIAARLFFGIIRIKGFTLGFENTERPCCPQRR